MKDDILMTIFGGGTLDWEMLDKCEYDFEDIYEDMKMFCSSYEDFDFTNTPANEMYYYIPAAIYIFEHTITDKIKKLAD